jgi:Matrixin/PEP-CTERM motif
MPQNIVKMCWQRMRCAIAVTWMATSCLLLASPLSAGVIDPVGGAQYAGHHETDGHAVHDAHFFAQTGDDHHYAWFGTTPASAGPVNIKYDFRAIGAFANVITAGQMARTVDALNVWSATTGGRVMFVRDTVATASQIINIGTGDLAALGRTSGPGGILGLGGGNFNHGAGHTITGGIAWQDFAETWDTTIGNGNPAGTFDYFTVVAQEVGHALGLGHTDNEGGSNLMNGSYRGELTAASAIDVDHMTSVYGFHAVPEPSSVGFCMFGLVCLAGRRWRHARRQRNR